MTTSTAEDLSPTLFFCPVAAVRKPADRGEAKAALRDIAARDRRGHVALRNHDLDAAERFFSEALELRQRIGAGAHTGLPQAFGLLGVVASYRGDLGRAETLFELGLEVARALRARLTAEDAMLLQNLGVVARRLGRLEEAEARHASALSIKVQALGPDHPSVAVTLGSLGAVLLLLRRPAEALGHFERAREIAARVSGPRSTCVAQLLLGSGIAHLKLGRCDVAERCFAAAVAVYGELPGAAKQLANSRLRLADARWHRDPAGARWLARSALANYLGSAHPDLRTLRRMQTWLANHIERAA